MSWERSFISSERRPLTSSAKAGLEVAITSEKKANTVRTRPSLGRLAVAATLFAMSVGQGGGREVPGKMRATLRASFSSTKRAGPAGQAKPDFAPVSVLTPALEAHHV